MDKNIKRRKITPKSYECFIEVKYIPFPNEKRREEAYDTHVKLFLRAKERELQEKGLISLTRV